MDEAPLQLLHVPMLQLMHEPRFWNACILSLVIVHNREPTLCATRSVPLKNVIGRVLRAQKRWSEVTNREAQAVRDSRWQCT